MNYLLYLTEKTHLSKQIPHKTRIRLFSSKPTRRIRPVPRLYAGKGLGTRLGKVLVRCLGGAKTVDLILVLVGPRLRTRL